MTVDAPERHSFSLVSVLRQTGEGEWQGEVHPEWTIVGKPNGGYLLAMLGRAATSASSHTDVIAASAHYLHSPDPGSVVVEAEVLRAGRSASQVRARMSQEGKPCVEALLTVSVLDPEKRPYWQAGLPEQGDAAFDDCLPMLASTPTGQRVAIYDQVDVRLEPLSTGWRSAQPAGRGELRGWLRLPAGEGFDATSLLYAVDSFPPATFDIEFAGWVPTLELTVYVRAVPAPGPVRVLQKAQLIDDQRVDEVCYIWDSTGRLVAQGTQLAGVRLG